MTDDQQPLNREQRRAQKFHRKGGGRQDNLQTQRENNTGFLSGPADTLADGPKDAVATSTTQGETEQVGAGTGLLYLLRWFWWRITAWCEIVAMISSFSISVFFVFLGRSGHTLGADQELLITVVFTTICWLITAYVGPQTDQSTLIEFFRKVRPPGPGWNAVRQAAKAEGYPHFYESRIQYILTTGGNWANGSIGKFKLTVDKGNPKALISFCGDNVKKVGPTTFETTAQDFYPERDIDILLLEPSDDGAGEAN